MTAVLLGKGALERTLVMGVMNITPDSFYDGGKLNNPANALARGRELVRDGTDILDIGGESSRPGAEPVSIEEECARVLPVIEALRNVGAPLSVDTYRAETARRALASRVSMVNDISALRMDPEMAGVIADAGCACVLMHMQGTPKTMQRAPHYDDVVDDICAFFEERLAYATGQGIAEESIWLDPGFGFGKTVEHNLTLLRRLAEFKRFGRPVLIGTSNKSTIGAVLDLPVDDRMEGTAATVAVAICHGADCVRVHDVKRMARVARMTDAVMRKGGVS
ncbi:MAG TPA: dihydropteroate synthase [Candidatus Hydrogenedentes bacterium]|nr:dihydropteroate synthase [Candidatus Hydrogenedentota bacterium]